MAEQGCLSSKLFFGWLTVLSDRVMIDETFYIVGYIVDYLLYITSISAKLDRYIL